MATSESLSTAQTLPSDIIFTILKHFSAPLVLYRFDQHPFPWYLAHVCSSWRSEFLTMRRHFWNEIRLQVWYSDTRMEKRHQRIMEVLTMFLERNRGGLFSFKLNVECGAASYPHLFPISNLLVSVSPRWQRVTLAIETADIPILQHVKGRLEHLESLELYGTKSGSIVPKAFTDLFMTAPRFTRLFLFKLSTWNFNWSIMTFMYICRIERTQVARLPSILSQTVRLETFTIYLGGATFPSIPSIMLPSLLSLVTDTFSLLYAITTPSLKNLRIGCGSVNPELVGIFFNRSRCHLQALELVSLNVAVVIEILSHTPDLRSLYLYHLFDSMGDIFGWLNGIHQVQAPKLTSLQSLTVYGCIPPRGTQRNKILDFISQRKTRVESVIEKLQELHMNWYLRHPSKVLEEGVRKKCILYDIQYSDMGKSYIQWEDVHGL